jgi:hypothetical protein
MSDAQSWRYRKGYAEGYAVGQAERDDLRVKVGMRDLEIDRLRAQLDVEISEATRLARELGRVKATLYSTPEGRPAT